MNEQPQISIDYKRIWAFVLSNWHYFALLLIIFLVVDIRNNISELPITDKWADNTIQNYIKNQAVSEIKTMYPALPDAKVQEQADQRLQDFMKYNSSLLTSELSRISNDYKSLLSYNYNGKQYVYLGDIDSYFWLRYAENILDHGTICDSVKNGQCWDDLEMAPLGRPTRPTIHPYVIAYTYKALHAVGIDMPLMNVALIAPTIIAVIVTIFAFIVGFIILGRLGGVISAAMISFNVVYLSRSLGSDNDIYNILIPLIILMFLFLALKSEKYWKICLFSILAGLSVGISKFVWEVGWWNIYNAIFYSFIGYFAFLVVYMIYTTKGINWKMFIKPATIFFLFVVFGLLCFTWVASVRNTPASEFIKAPILTLDFMKFSKAAVKVNVWPNVLNTVAEFNPLALSNVPGQVFGQAAVLFLALGLFGIFVLFLKEVESNNIKYWFLAGAGALALFLSNPSLMSGLPKMVYFLFVLAASMAVLAYFLLVKLPWDQKYEANIMIGLILIVSFIGALYASTMGVRFTLLLVMPAGIAIAIGLTYLYEETKSLIGDQHKYYQLAANVITTMVVILIVSLQVQSSYNIATNFLPNYNAAWDVALSNIRENSQPDAIVNSWWDFGHWFKYTTKRGVTLDGATQNNPPLHWLGKLLLTTNEDESRGILKMLDCGSNTAYDKLYNRTADASRVIEVLSLILPIQSRIDANLKLSELGYSNPDEITQLTHCNAPENYLIVSDDMIGKAPVWAHFGSWDFNKAEIAVLKLLGKSKSEIFDNLSSDDKNMTDRLYKEISRLNGNDQINAWIAPWPQFLGNQQCTVINNTINCGGVLFYNGKDCYFSTNNVVKYPTRCFVDNTLKSYDEDIYSNQGRIVGVAFARIDNSSAVAILSDYQLTGSMFQRLYQFNGQGLNNFVVFDRQQSPLGTTIMTYKSVW